MAVQDGVTLHVAAFIMEQTAARTSPVIDHLTTVDEVERRSRLDFFSEPSDTKTAHRKPKASIHWRILCSAMVRALRTSSLSNAPRVCSMLSLS